MTTTDTTSSANDNRPALDGVALDAQPAANDNTPQPAPSLTYRVDPSGCVYVLRPRRRRGDDQANSA